MLRPAPLALNDKVYLLSTARYISIESIEEAIQLLIQNKLLPVIGKTIGLQQNQYAGSDIDRAKDFQMALDDPSIKAIWFAKGGYGSIRVLDYINWDKFVKNPKWLIGFSDMTIWHNHVNQFFGIQTIHAIMPTTFNINTEVSKRLLIQNITGNLPNIVFNNSSRNINDKEVSGELIGGNLSILYSLLGTNTGWNTKGKILYIEEIDEYLYHIDRMIISIKKAGKFLGLKALIVGGFTDIRDNETPFGSNVYDIINEHCGEYGFPIFYDFPAGHIDNNLPLLLGAEIQIYPTENNMLSLHYL